MNETDLKSDAGLPLTLTISQIQAIAQYAGLNVTRLASIAEDSRFVVHSGPVYDGEEVTYEGLMIFAADDDGAGVLALE
ncbi:hypothetical protein R950_002629 [Salmonella enterica subsp. enterica]|nr:hypothetical protein [Salmonella enterica subsp. enterica serovar Aba]EBU7767326.1 hypothetical protein [Salmonella enterica subsp. enterica serovar Rovaniemi]EBY6828037.1 hypothetical protein [Salmonella enterica subsp. enterica serovar Aba]EDW2260635.1 hypothetical protein [Salmonella enterica subsp. enterica serovar Langford]EGF4599823.1 hypothetical protein [Salmonella enterica subsp. enterica serovar Agama]